MSKLDWVLAVLIIGGAILFGVGSNGEILAIQIAGLSSAGIGLLAGSFKLARTGRLAFWKVRRMGEGEVQGFYAGLWGLILFVSGVGLLVAAGERLLGRESSVIDFFARHPGPLWAILSLIPITAGYPSVFTPSLERAPLTETVRRVLERIRGLLLFLLGFILFALGMFEIFFPSGYDSLLQSIADSLNSLF
jgi:hypothetical protein